MPGVVKYSALARKVTLRGTITGMKNESEKERWLLAMITGRSSGCSPALRSTAATARAGLAR